MRLLDVPLTSDPAYAAFLAGQVRQIDSVHCSLGDPALADARQRLAPPDPTGLRNALEQLADVPAFILMNARLHAPEKYFSRAALDDTAARLDRLIDLPNVRGVIFGDAYFLQALSDAHPDLAGRLEAVPSVNAMLDSSPKTLAMLDMIAGTAFKPPSRLILDRSLNRDRDRLAETSRALRAACPGLKLFLLANEGCLYQCPYKPAHDAHIALVNEGLCGERTFALNRDLGCVRRFLTDPGTIPASPFIRPEDADHYAEHIDGLKLCGRNRGTPFLRQTVNAYLAGEYPGNLLDLLDTLGDLAGHLDMPNHRLPPDFADRVTTCDKNCRACGWCARVMEKIGSRQDPGLTRL